MTPTENTMEIFDRALLTRKRARAARIYGDYSFLINEVGDRLFDRLRDVNRGFKNILEIGARDQRLTKKIKRHSNPEFLFTSDLTDVFGGNDLLLDEEFLPFKETSFDLIISNLNLHWVNDLPGALIQINKVLKPDGLFLATMFGGDTLIELRDSLMLAEMEILGGVSPRVSPFADIRDTGSLLQRAGMALPVCDIDTITVDYPNAFKLMDDLRGMGESNNVLKRSKTPMPRSMLMKTAEIYSEKYGKEDGRIPATFQVIFLTGWHPHESQQQPLKPGSAKMRLADALKTEEIGTGEKTGE